ncbi:MAG: antitoxin VapB family protein [Candidatus Freyrarchaeum guaymaensis]|mgnify:CR=1 FL=1|nr:antitoxin VapB family protein [Candidatus Sigynarchaeota archaeon]
MGHKTITISEEAYNSLVALKRENESFTEVILRVVSTLNRKPLTWFAGKWAGDEAELDRILKVIRNAWAEYEERLGEEEDGLL